MSVNFRRPLISGNWKMNHNHFDAIQFVQKLAYLVTKEDFEVVDVSLNVPFTDIRSGSAPRKYRFFNPGESL